jgi:hypothetical protein
MGMGSGTALGQERLGSDLAIAVNPTNSSLLYVAYASVDVNTGMPQVNVAFSTDKGATWPANQQFTIATNSALPALAVAQNGVVGLLYTKLAGGNLETHFLESSNNFATKSDWTLARFPDNNPMIPAGANGLYIGDYQGLVAVGNMFFGTFSASNNPNSANFPDVKNVLFNRSFKDVNNNNQNAGGFLRGAGSLIPAGTAISIDPYFFSVQAIKQ